MVRAQANFIALAGGASAGNFGCEVWIAKRWSGPSGGPEVVLGKDDMVMTSWSPRHVFVAAAT
eukprot:8591323-Lingulodinium_polyedra.AAC.1